MVLAHKDQHSPARGGGSADDAAAADAEPVVAAFEVRFTRFLDASGRPVGALPDFARDVATLTELYRAMTLARAFDTKAISLQRTGRLGTYSSCLGQEAIGVGLASAMAEADVLLPSYRETAAQLWRGVELEELLLYWGGDERGSAFAKPRHDFPISIPVGSHAPHAVGVATAFKLRRERRVAVCAVGDGATSKGDFYEAINLAGVWRLPVIFVVSNNQWAISVPRRDQTGARTLAQKAIAAGFEGEQVDGNDVIAVRHAVGQAIERAREGKGPGLIEALTYRLGDHTTADDASRYRDDEEVSRARAEEPLARLRAYLTAKDAWDKAAEERVVAECTQRIEAAVATYLATAAEGAEAMFDHLYAELPASLARQRAAAAEDGDG